MTREWASKEFDRRQGDPRYKQDRDPDCNLPRVQCYGDSKETDFAERSKTEQVVVGTKAVNKPKAEAVEELVGELSWRSMDPETAANLRKAESAGGALKGWVQGCGSGAVQDSSWWENPKSLSATGSEAEPTSSDKKSSDTATDEGGKGTGVEEEFDQVAASSAAKLLLSKELNAVVVSARKELAGAEETIQAADMKRVNFEAMVALQKRAEYLSTWLDSVDSDDFVKKKNKEMESAATINAKTPQREVFEKQVPIPEKLFRLSRPQYPFAAFCLRKILDAEVFIELLDASRRGHDVSLEAHCLAVTLSRHLFLELSRSRGQS